MINKMIYQLVYILVSLFGAIVEYLRIESEREERELTDDQDYWEELLGVAD